MTTKIDDFIKKVKSTAEEDFFTPRTFYHLSSSMFHEMCELLKEQEPRVMTLLEIEQSEKCIVWFEDDQFNNYALVDGIDQRNGWVWLITVNNIGSQQRRDYENYGKRWRCWTKRPEEDQRRRVKLK